MRMNESTMSPHYLLLHFFHNAPNAMIIGNFAARNVLQEVSFMAIKEIKIDRLL